MISLEEEDYAQRDNLLVASGKDMNYSYFHPACSLNEHLSSIFEKGGSFFQV